MIEKDYYRLDELFHLGVTEGTIRYFIEQGKLTPSFFVPRNWYVLGGYINDDFHGFAIATYQGLVSFSANENTTLLTKGKVTSNSLKLLQPDQIVIHATDYPFNIPCPNSYILGWQKWNLNQFNSSGVPAKTYPRESDSGMTIFVNFVSKLVEIAKVEDRTLKVRKEEILENYPKKVLISAGRDFVFTDICVRHEDLIFLGIMQPRPEKVCSPPRPESNANVGDVRSFKNEFEELLVNILKSKPRIKAKQVHRILCDECAREEDSRLFDHRNILTGEDQGIISWRDKYRSNAERSYTQASLNNLISEARKCQT